MVKVFFNSVSVSWESYIPVLIFCVRGRGLDANTRKGEGVWGWWRMILSAVLYFSQSPDSRTEGSSVKKSIGKDYCLVTPPLVC